MQTGISSPARANFQDASLLVIEDQDDVWFLMRYALSKGLPEVTVKRVSSGSQALAYLTSLLENGADLPKLILQDLYLPNRNDGLKLLVAIRNQLAEGSYPQLPIVVFSSSTDPDDVQQCYRVGASSYLIKHMDISRQIANIQSLRQFWWETNVLPFHASDL